MKFSPNQSPAQTNHRRQGRYPANGLHYLGERGERKEHPAEEEHGCDKQGKIVVKAIKRRDERGKEDGNRREHYTSQK